MSRIFYCEACKKVVDPIVGTLVEMLDDMHDRRPSCQVSDRNLCPHCSDPVDEIVACIECKEAAPEDGADHCTACLNKLESDSVHFSPHALFYEIAAECARRSTKNYEVFAEIRSVNGRPVAVMRRERPPMPLEAALRLGSDVRLFARQAD